MIDRITISAPSGSEHHRLFNRKTHVVQRFVQSRLSLEAGAIRAIHIILTSNIEDRECSLATKDSIKVYDYIDMDLWATLPEPDQRVRICEYLFSNLATVGRTMQYGWSDAHLRAILSECIAVGDSYSEVLLPEITSPDGEYYATCICEWGESELAVYSCIFDNDFVLRRKDLLIRGSAWNAALVDAVRHKWSNSTTYHVKSQSLWTWTADISTHKEVGAKVKTSGGTK